MRIALCRNDTAFSLGIRLVTREDGYDVSQGFSHAAVVFNNNTVMDSMWSKGGVRAPRSLASFLSAHPDAVIVDVTLPNEGAAVAFALAQIGKGYDKEALLAFLVPAWITGRRNWQFPDLWFCSEFAGAVLVQGGFKLDVPTNFLSPNGLARVLGVPKCNRAGMACSTT